MWLLIFLITTFSLLSQAMMGYLVMHWPTGPWVGPVFIVVCMTLAVPFVSKKWFTKHAILTITSGSIGEIIGLSVGMTLPSFYFLQKTEFLNLLQKPLMFSTIISLLILCAGFFSFLLIYLIKDNLIIKDNLPFPISKTIYDIVSVEQYSDQHRLMWTGVGLTFIWNIAIFIIKSIFHKTILSLQTLPMIIPIGFVAGHALMIPVICGLITRMFAINILHKGFFCCMHQKEFLIIFCLGMLSSKIAHGIIEIFIKYKLSIIFGITSIKSYLLNKYFCITCIIFLGLSYITLHALGIKTFEMIFILIVLIMVGTTVAKIIGEIGVISINDFVWCLILPLLYVSSISSINLLIVSLFVTLCFGLIINLIFSYKLAHLAKISYNNVLKYQIYGFFISTITCGFIMWFYAQQFNEQSLYLFSSNTQDLDAIINFGAFNYKVFICGILSGAIILFTNLPLLSIVGATLIDPITSIWLIIAGAASYLVKEKEKFYPFWFGIYATHTVCIIILTMI